MSTDTVTLSIVIPVYNEADNLTELYRRLHDVLSGIGETYEMIFVNDGSTDDSLEIMKNLREQDHNIKIINLSRNWGHQVALTVGLDHASGQVAITMDADLQHPPECIPLLVEKWRNGYEIVQTIRQGTADSGLFKRLTSAWYYVFFRAISQANIRPGAADFRLLDAKPLAALRNLRERRRFLRGLVPWLGFRTTYVTYSAEQRFAGRPKYSLTRMMGLALSGILSFSTFPLRLSLYLGLLLGFLNSLYVLYIFYAYLFRGTVVPGWTSLMLIVLFLSSVQFIMQGILGEYVATIFEEVKQRPLYMIQDLIGFDHYETGADVELSGMPDGCTA